ncbi:phosphatidate cytidylyltransferase [Stappia indica]|uniref:phosphatidate cytidylyltransferase n=1 Tax=Stappia indica TaxID=538381 RepID=UPI00082EC076|nr:phosphatidate cytidylyltransferase [Stappia indica]
MTGGAAGGGRPRATELKLRVVSALLLAPAVLAITWLGGWFFAAGAALCSAILLQEWTVIVQARREAAAIVVSGLGIAVMLVAAALGLVPLALGLAFSFAALLWVWGQVSRKPAIGWMGTGVLYAGLTGVALIAFRLGAEGFVMILFLFAVVWATDILAYFVGRRVGGPKLWPRVSPKKTWSGALGGLAASLLVGAVMGALVGRVPVSLWIVSAGILSVFSQAGDLLESALKRRFGVKDSGHIIPGHGGVMDRVDGLTGAGILGYLVAAVLAGSLVDPVGAVIALQGY